MSAPLSGCGAPIAGRRCTAFRRPSLLDAFSCAGGAGMGYHRAGFCVTGVDINPQPRYPFHHEVADCLLVAESGSAYGGYVLEHGHLFAAIHGSPPCQRYSDLARRNGNGADHPDFVAPLRIVLQSLWATCGIPWVIENVDGSPLRDATWLCGTQFPGLRVLRHRGFESSVTIPSLPHVGRHPLVFTHDKRKAHYGRLDQNVSFVQVTGGGNATLENKRAAMGTPWMNSHEVNEAIPPAFTEYVGRFVLEAVTAEAVAA